MVLCAQPPIRLFISARFLLSRDAFLLLLPPLRESLVRLVFARVFVSWLWSVSVVRHALDGRQPMPFGFFFVVCVCVCVCVLWWSVCVCVCECAKCEWDVVSI